MKQYTYANRNVPLSLHDAVVTRVELRGDTLVLGFDEGIRDLFRERPEQSGCASITVSRIDWSASSLQRFGDETYETLEIKRLHDLVRVGRLEIVDELYGYNQLLFRCMWLTDTACHTVELSLYHHGPLVARWEDDD